MLWKIQRMENNLIQIKAIDHINFRVQNLEESVRFYGKLFGFEEKERENVL